MNKFNEIRARCDAATPALYGTWAVIGDEHIHPWDAKCSNKKEDIWFIANARTDISLLLKALELSCKAHKETIDNNFCRCPEHCDQNIFTPEYWLEKAEKE